jgi:hypothetical protein
MALGDILAALDPNLKKISQVTGVPLSKKQVAEQQISQKEKALRKSIQETPTYQIPQETQQLLDLYQTQGAKLEDLAGLGQEATNIAKAQTSMVEAPGLGIARDQIQAGTAGTVQNIIEAGGGSASSLEAIAQAGQNELNAMRDLAITNQQYKQQASDEYQQALMNQAGLESSLLGQSTALQAAGLQTMIGQKGLVYQSELDKQRTLQQLDITQLGNLVAAEEARKNRNAQIASAAIGGLFSLGSTALTAGLGGAAGTAAAGATG